MFCAFYHWITIQKPHKRLSLRRYGKPLKMAKKLLALYLIGTVSISVAAPINDQEQGAEFYRYIQAAMPISNDLVANDYINHLGYQLVAHSNEPSKPFHFFIVNDNQINAFAGPGGYIGIYAGLIKITTSESELASVMAHETAHVTQHHLARGQEKMDQTVLPSVAAIAAAIATGEPSIAVGGLSAVAAGNAQYYINNTRGFEQEADASGITLLAKAGFDPYDMSAFFEKMQEQSRYDHSVPPILLTHPVSAERVAAARNRAVNYPKTKHTASPSYFLIKSRLTADLSTDKKTFFENSQARALKTPDDPYAQYQYALALSYTNHASHAIKILDALAHQFPHQIIYPYTAAEIDIKQKNTEKAIAVLEKLYPYNDGYYPLILLLAHSYNLNHQSIKAIRLLNKYEVEYANDAAFWILFSTAEAAQDNLLYAYLYRANAYSLYGDTKKAKIQLDMASRQPNQTPYTKQLIDAKLEQLK
jgi:beta-barrel assembly-enhancing protease